MVHWSPFVMSFKKKYPWIQLAGHAGSTALLGFLSIRTLGSLGSYPARGGRGLALDTPRGESVQTGSL